MNLKILVALGLFLAPVFAYADPITAVFAIVTIAEAATGAAALAAGVITLGTVAAGVAFAGGAIALVGAVTKDKGLEKVGGYMSLAGGALGAVDSLANAGGSALAGAGGDVNVNPKDLQLAAGSETAAMSGEGSAAAAAPGAASAGAGAPSGAAPPTQAPASSAPDFGGTGTDASVAAPGSTSGVPQSGGGQLAGASPQGGSSLSMQSGATSAPQTGAIGAPQQGLATPQGGPASPTMGAPQAPTLGAPGVQAPNVQAGAAPGVQAPTTASGFGGQGMDAGVASGAGAGDGPATQLYNAGKGLVNGALGFAKDNPQLMNVVGQGMAGMAQGRAALATAQYNNQAYIAMQQRFSDSVKGMNTYQAIRPGGQAVYGGSPALNMPPPANRGVGLVNGQG